MLILFPTLVEAEESFVLYCSEEISPGFIYESGRWQAANFKERRYTIQVLGDWRAIVHEDENYSCYATEFRDFQPTLCKNDKSYDTSTFNIDRKSLRYVYTNALATGYASPLTTDTDTFSAGTCEKF